MTSRIFVALFTALWKSCIASEILLSILSWQLVGLALQFENRPDCSFDSSLTWPDLSRRTDIMDKNLGADRKLRWNKAFAEEAQDKVECTHEDVNRKATIVIERKFWTARA